MSLFDKLFYNTWNIGFVESSSNDIILDEATQVQVKWLKHSYRDRFFADPFILSIDDDVIKVLVEDFPYYDKYGMISLLTVDRNKFTLISKEVILKCNHHLSYPFILRDETNSIKVIPESSGSGVSSCYEMNCDSNQLEFKSEFFPEPLLDPTIVYYNKYWWLFCTKAGEESNKKLYLYYSESPTGPWLPHGMNPIVESELFARPGGYCIATPDCLYRLAQKCDRTYGEAINVLRINTLTPTEYDETFVKEIRAQKDDYHGHFHTLNGCGDITVVDGIKKEFRPLMRCFYEFRNFFKL